MPNQRSSTRSVAREGASASSPVARTTPRPRSKPTPATPTAAEAKPDGHLSLPMAQRSPLMEAASHEDLIRRRAYERYERNGCVPGREVEDWLAAEAEVGAMMMVGRVSEG